MPSNAPDRRTAPRTPPPAAVAWLGYGGLVPFVVLAVAVGIAGAPSGDGARSAYDSPAPSGHGAPFAHATPVQLAHAAPALLTHAAPALLAYGAVILSFVGALHWAFAMTLPDLPARRRRAAFVWSVVPALLAWVALGLAPAPAAALLVAGFLAQYRRDVGLARLTALSGWYLPLRLRLTTVACVCLAVGGLVGQGGIAAAHADESPYRQAPASPDGIGKRYDGREIAHVMGFAGAEWLERPGREREERPDILVEELHLQPGMTVADIGAGSGYLSRRLAPLVAPGRVFAVDVQPEMVALLTTLAKQPGMGNLVPRQGAPDDVRLPAASVDAAVMVDVYHELEFPYEVMRSIVQALKPGGRVVFVEYRGEDPSVPILPLHKMSVAQVRREMQRFPLVWERTAERLPLQHVIVFRKAPH